MRKSLGAVGEKATLGSGPLLSSPSKGAIQKEGFHVKKFLALLLGLMMIVSMLSVASAESSPVTISVWCAYAGEDPYG